MDISAFLSADKSMVIAPAGYGKTHTIADCISHYTGNKKNSGFDTYPCWCSSFERKI